VNFSAPLFHARSKVGIRLARLFVHPQYLHVLSGGALALAGRSDVTWRRSAGTVATTLSERGVMRQSGRTFK